MQSVEPGLSVGEGADVLHGEAGAAHEQSVGRQARDLRRVDRQVWIDIECKYKYVDFLWIGMDRCG